MKPFLTILITVFFMTLSIDVVQAQLNPEDSNLEITYGETRSSLVVDTTDNQFSEFWNLLDTATGDIPRIRVTRISGQFSPSVRLFDKEGNPLSVATNRLFNDTDEIIYEMGLPSEGAPFHIEVSGSDVISSRENPVEYSLSVEWDGITRSSPDDGIDALPTVGTSEAPQLATGEAQTIASLTIPVFGQAASLENSILRGTSPEPSLTLNQSIPLFLGVSNITFLNNGIGLTIQNEVLFPNPERRFFSDESFTVAYNDLSGDYTFTMSSGMQIVTTFAQIESIEVREGIAAFRIQIGDESKRLLFDNQSINVRRSSGENYTLQLDGETITSDLAIWDTFASYRGQYRVYVGTDSRLISDLRFQSITGNASTGQQTIIIPPSALSAEALFPLTLNINWSRMSEILIDSETVRTETRNGFIATEPIANLVSVLVEDAAVQFTNRFDEVLTFRSVFPYGTIPDGTIVNTLTEPSSNSDILPWETGFRTRNYNNLGADILPTCSCSNEIQAHTPINPTNGNFFYPVTDFSILAQSFALNLTRYYNSHDNRSPQGIVIDSLLMPRYFSSTSLDYARFGNGWRYSYQHELNITNAPQGRITYIEPDGTGHYFFSTDGIEWISRTLLSMRIFREGGSLGTWRAETTDGLGYYFDRIGRLSRIKQRNQSIILTLAPLEYLDNAEAGTFVVGPYGRRLELYIGASNRIEMSRDSTLSEINYTYNGTLLVGVQYEPRNENRVANYSYDDIGLLAHYDDVRSPYTQVGNITYDFPQKRVVDYIENPDNDLQRQYLFEYSHDGEERITRRSLVISDTLRPVQSWIYNDIWQLTNVNLPVEDWDYQFAYDPSSGVLQSVRVPTDVSFQLSFDEWGNLTRFVDPNFTESPYVFIYQQVGAEETRSLLMQIRYPNNGIETFTWSDEEENALLESRTTLISRDPELVSRVTNFEYDDLGRLVMLSEPGNIATIYSYDEIGYVAAVWEGIELQENETRADITNRIRASRVTDFSYNLVGQLTSLIDPRGASYFITWNNNGQRIDGPARLSREYVYNDRGLIERININDRAQSTIYTYNGLDLVEFVSQEDGGRQNFDYDAAGNLLTVSKSLEQSADLNTDYEYDALGNLTLERSPSGLVTRYTTTLDLESNAIVRIQVDPTGRILTRRYDLLGRLDLYTIGTEENPVFQEFGFNYRSNGNLRSIEETTIGEHVIVITDNEAGDILAINVNESETSFAYNERGLLSQVTSPAGLTTQYFYDPLGNIERVIMPDETVWQYRYDESSNLIAVIDPQGTRTDYIPDNVLNQLEQTINALVEVESYSYDNRGNLISVTDAEGVNTNYSYDPLDRLASITNGLGQTRNYEYDLLGRLERIIQTGASEDRSIAYDNDNNIIATTDERGQRTLYSYDGLGRVTSITDPLGHTTSYEYNPLGLVTNIRDALGNNQSFEWRSGTNFLRNYTSTTGQRYNIITDELGRVTQILPILADDDMMTTIDTQVSYNNDGYIEEIRVGERAISFAYNANGDPISYTDALGGEWILDYDELGHITSITNPQAVSTRYGYDLGGRITSVVNYADTDSAYTEVFQYYRNGTIRAYEIDSIIRNEYTYNPVNLLLTANLAVGTDETVSYSFEYNAFGRITRINEPGGRQREYLYSIRDPNNLGSYTIRGATSGDTPPTRLTVRYDYDDAGNLTSITLPRLPNDSEEDINITYDALNRRVRYVDNTDNSWAYTYDNAGNIAQISDPLGSAVSYQYDLYNRITEIEYPSNNTVNLSYDLLGNLASVQLSPNANNSEQAIQYRLDEIGQIEAFQLATDFVAFEYDSLGNVVERRTPDGTITSYTYDEAGRLRSISYGEDVPSFVYDYDVLGNLLSVDDIQFEYDVLGRITQATGSTSLNYNYDFATGNLESRQSDLLGEANYSYDDLYRIETINFANQALSISYDARGRIAEVTRDNGLITRILYDKNDRITQIQHSTPTEDDLDQFIYAYDAVGNLIKVERFDDINSASNNTEVSYSYDIDQRLISERWLDEGGETVYVVNYQYDAVGNRILEDRNGQITRYTYNGQNQLISEQRNVSVDGRAAFFVPSLMLGIAGIMFVGRRRRKLWILIPVFSGLFVGIVFAQNNPQVTVTYEYDVNGNMTFIIYNSVETFELDMDYDTENRLISVQGQSISFNEDNEPIGVDIDTRYTYDVFSRVVAIDTLDASYTLYYDGHTLIGMSDGERIERYLDFNGQRILTITGENEILWNLNDRIGSTRRYADSTDNLIDDESRRLEFGAFGTRIFPYDVERLEPIGAAVSDPSQFFAGQLYDPSTGLYLMGVRAYDPIVGRFLQPDPVRQDPVGNLYTYARNRPLVFQDPTGMFVEPLTEPLDIAALDSQINPENLIPRPYIAPIPELPAVYRLQADETFRALQLIEATRFGVNDTVLQLSPFNDELYLFTLNPLPSDIQGFIRQPLDQMMAIYENGDGWIPDPRPNPTIAYNPFDILSEVAPTIARAYVNPLGYNNDALQSLSILPSVPIPQGLSERDSIEETLTQLLQPIQPIIAFETEADMLFDLVPPDFVPTVNLPSVDLPTAVIEPAIIDNLDALREQTYDFYSRIWVIGIPDCDDCLPPLGFSQ